MGDPGTVVQSVGEGNFEASVQFLTGWVSDGAAEARAYLADHAEPAGASLIAVHGNEIVGYVAIVWESNFDGFRDRGVPLVHQLAVAGPFRAQRPLGKGMQVTMDDDLIMWLTKELIRLR